MKSKNSIYGGIFTIGLTLMLTTACSSQNENEDKSNPSGNNNPTDMNSGNHANDPQALPGTNYPGSAGEDSGHTKGDTLHKGLR